jgi:hypothetical protein
VLPPTASHDWPGGPLVSPMFTALQLAAGLTWCAVMWAILRRACQMKRDATAVRLAHLSLLLSQRVDDCELDTGAAAAPLIAADVGHEGPGVLPPVVDVALGAATTAPEPAPSHAAVPSSLVAVLDGSAVWAIAAAARPLSSARGMTATAGDEDVHPGWGAEVEQPRSRLEATASRLGWLAARADGADHAVNSSRDPASPTRLRHDAGRPAPIHGSFVGPGKDLVIVAPLQRWLAWMWGLWLAGCVLHHASMTTVLAHGAALVRMAGARSLVAWIVISVGAHCLAIVSASAVLLVRLCRGHSSGMHRRCGTCSMIGIPLDCSHVLLLAVQAAVVIVDVTAAGIAMALGPMPLPGDGSVASAASPVLIGWGWTSAVAAASVCGGLGVFAPLLGLAAFGMF